MRRCTTPYRHNGAVWYTRKNMIGRTIQTISALVVLLFCGCAKKERELGGTLTKKVDRDKLLLIVLSKSEYDQSGNIIHKKTGSYADKAGNSFSLEEKLKGKRAFSPVLSDFYDIYYQHDYDENGNVIHTFIHNTKDEDTLEYVFDYDECGKIVHCKNSSGDEHWYEYDERGNMTKRTSYFDSVFNRLLEDEEKYVQTDFTHEYEDSFVETKIDSNGALFFFGRFSFERYYSALGRIRTLRVASDDEERIGLIRFRDRDKEPRVDYRYGEKVNTEYYTNYQSRVYGYGRYFGSEPSPVGVDGKIYFDTDNRSNKAARTFIEYYLRDDGSVENSIEYTGFRKTAYHKRIYRSRSYVGSHWGYSLFPDHYEYD